MPDLCRGSGSHADPFAGELVTLGVSEVAGALNKFFGGRLSAFLAPIIALATFELTVVCNSPAPDPVTLTQTDLNSLGDVGDIIPFGIAQKKLNQWFLSWYWQFLCRCNDGLAPALPAIPTVTGTVGQSPGLPNAPVGSSCWDQVLTSSVAGNNNVNFNDLAPRTALLPTGNLQFPVWAFPTPPPTSLTFTGSVSTDGTDGTGYRTAIFFADANGNNIVGTNYLSPQFAPGSAGDSRNIAVPATAKGVQVIVEPSGVVVPTKTQASGELTYYCGTNTPTTPAVPCCPPDQNMVDMLNRIYAMVTLLQRQVAPFAYVPGATHSTLTGNGELSVQGLLGVKVLPTTIPPGVGVDTGDPDTLWLDSWITWGNPDGWIEREWLRSSPYVSMPQLAGQFTKLGYTLRAGLAVDIVELKREP